jgi:hypothetical protein
MQVALRSLLTTAFPRCTTVGALQAPTADTAAPSDTPTFVPVGSSTPPPTAVSSSFFGDGSGGGSATSTPVPAAVPGLPGLPVVPDNNGTGAPVTGTVTPAGTVAPPVPGGGLPVFPGGASTAPPSSLNPAATDSPFDPPTAAPTAAPSAVSRLCVLHLLN